MTRSYALDQESAKQAGASNYINETGKYVGMFIRAEAIVSQQNTEGVEFTFKSRDGQTADYLSCWTYNVDGKPIYGLKVLNALMTCMRVRNLAPAEIIIKDKDGQAKRVEGFPDLMNKPIGVLLQREAYMKSNQTEGFKFNIVGCFDPANEMTAAEILDKAAAPKQLAGWVNQLRDKPMQAQRAAGAAPARATATTSGGDSAGFADEDIPFADPYGRHYTPMGI